MLLSSGGRGKGACCKVVCVANLWLDLACLVVLVLCRHSWGIPFSKLRLVCLCRLPGLPLLPLPSLYGRCLVACLAAMLPCVLLTADPVVLVLVVLLVVAVALVDFLALFTFILLLLLLPPVWAIFLS